MRYVPSVVWHSFINIDEKIQIKPRLLCNASFLFLILLKHCCYVAVVRARRSRTSRRCSSAGVSGSSWSCCSCSWAPCRCPYTGLSCRAGCASTSIAWSSAWYPHSQIFCQTIWNYIWSDETGKLCNIIMHVIWANRKADLCLSTHAMFDVMCYPAFVRASDIILSVVLIR